MSKLEIANKIKQARLSANMTQAEASRALGCTYQAISNYERGTSRIEVDVLVKLCTIYGVDINEILGIEKTAAPKDSGLSPLDAQLMDYVRRLTDDQKRMLLAQIELLLKTQG